MWRVMLIATRGSPSVANCGLEEASTNHTGFEYAVHTIYHVTHAIYH